MSVIMNVLNTVRQENEEKESKKDLRPRVTREELKPTPHLAEKMNALNSGVIEEEVLAAATGSVQALSQESC